MRTLIEEREVSLDHPAIQRAVGRPALREVVRVVARHVSGTSLEIPRQRKLTRMLCSYLGVHEALRPLREVASVLGLRSAGYVSSLARRCELPDDKRAALKRHVDYLNAQPASNVAEFRSDSDISRTSKK